MADKSKNFSIIDHGLTVEGTVSCRGRLVVKGIVKGALEGETIIIAKEGAVYSDTKVASMTVSGIFEGSVRVSEELIILSTGRCSGKVVCKNLVVEAGGVLNAEVSCIQFQEVKPPAKFASAAK